MAMNGLPLRESKSSTRLKIQTHVKVRSKHLEIKCIGLLNDLQSNKSKNETSVFSYESSSEEEVILVHAEISGHLQDFDAHLKAEEQLVDLKQSPTRVSAEDNTRLG